MKYLILIMTMCVLFITNANAKDENQEPTMIEVTGRPEYAIRFQPVKRYTAEETKNEIEGLLNELGWEGWHGTVYKYDASNKDGSYYANKQAIFEEWVKGEGYDYIEPIWGENVLDPKIWQYLGQCKKYIRDSSFPKQSASSAKYFGPNVQGHEFQFPPHLGPVALYKIDPSKLPNEKKSKNYVIVVIHNYLGGKYLDNFLQGIPVTIGDYFFRSGAFLFDLDQCTHSLYPAHHSLIPFGGYKEDAHSEMNGFMYYNDEIRRFALVHAAPKGMLRLNLYSFSFMDMREEELLNLRNWY